MEMQMPWSYVFAVVITGLLVVFVGLILLIACISIIGKIITAIEKKKTEKPSDVNAAGNTVISNSMMNTTVVSDDDEIIAVISAAVAMMAEADNTSYRIKSVKLSSNTCGSSRTAWATAGLLDSTKPF